MNASTNAGTNAGTNPSTNAGTNAGTSTSASTRAGATTRVATRATTLGTALLLTALLGTPACAAQLGDGASPRAQAAAAFTAGQYDEAIALYRRLADDTGADAETRAADRRALLRALAETGEYDAAAEAGRRYGTDASAATAIANALGEVLYRRGAVAEAERLFQQAAASGAADSLDARLNLAVLRFERGEHAAAVRDFDRFIDVYNQHGSALTSQELVAVGTAVRYLGRQDPQLFKDALRAYDGAIAADSSNLEARVLLAELFLEKYNSPDAAATLDGVLRMNPRHPRALLAAARRRYADGEPGATELVRQALAVNPNLVPARAMLGVLQLDVEDHAAAEAEAQKALAVDAGAIDALAVLAAAHHLRGDRAGFDAARARAAARNPKHAEFYVTLAELSARNRLYADAVTFARQGVTLDSAAARAHALLGINALRTGAMDDGRRSLEVAFARDPYDVWTKNTLDLLDAVRDYETVETPHFHLVMAEREAALLALYAGELAEEAYARMSERYAYRPAGPIRLELYPRHADFSVRTVGLAGLGALGVSFGDVLAMDSPAARDAGTFNWGSTLWHEVAHTFTLGASRNKVPRWLSEGISVYEERRARSGWGADATPAFLAAYKGGRLHPVSQLNDGFMRPAYPAQVIFSYYQASLVAELIEREHGANALSRMLQAYGQGLTTPDVFRQVLGSTPQAFDAAFDAYLRERFATQLAAVGAAPHPRGDDSARATDAEVRAPEQAVAGELAEQLGRARQALDAGRDDDALRHLERAKVLFPGLGGPDSPHRLLAQLHERRGNVREAAAELTAHTAVDENDHEANLKIAGLHEQLGDTAGAAAALERSLWVAPYDATVHQRLAAHYARTGNRAGAVRERRAVVALAPVDEAEARYQLALALQQAGEGAAARREVLRALEIAPAFEAAQLLLLSLRGAGTAGSGGRP